MRFDGEEEVGDVGSVAERVVGFVSVSGGPYLGMRGELTRPFLASTYA
jgi:hypothetical protein